MLLHGSRESCVDLGFRTGLQDLELQAFRACGPLCRVDAKPYLRALRVDEIADHPRLGNQLGDQLDPFLPQLRVEVGGASNVAARSREASDEAGLDRVETS